MTVPKAAGNLDPVALETSLIELWNEEKTFVQSIENRRPKQSPFTFLEGPPTANGKPGIHHVISRLYKDMVCRWKTMEGHIVESCLLYTSPSPRDQRGSRMPSSA